MTILTSLQVIAEKGYNTATNMKVGTALEPKAAYREEAPSNWPPLQRRPDVTSLLE